MLPHEIAVLAAEPAPDGFSARFDARSRAYRYRVLARAAPSPFERHRALWWPHAIDLPALEACGAALAGTHDFTAFTPTDTYHQRFERDVRSAAWRREGDLLVFEIEADSFMRHMNRVLVGTMLEVAGGRRSVEDFDAAAGGPPAGRGGAHRAAARALPHGSALLNGCPSRVQ